MRFEGNVVGCKRHTGLRVAESEPMRRVELKLVCSSGLQLHAEAERRACGIESGAQLDRCMRGVSAPRLPRDLRDARLRLPRRRRMAKGWHKAPAILSYPAIESHDDFTRR